MISFRTKKEKEHLVEKAKKMQDYADMIVECLEKSDYDEEYEERNYRHHDYEEYDEMPTRYDYRRINRRMR